MIGYPNAGKSSVINALMGKPCCKAAPLPGETKVWQYITLTKKIFLIDCPGVVYDVGDDEVRYTSNGSVFAWAVTCSPAIDQNMDANIANPYRFLLLQVETVLKGVVRAERLQSPGDFVAPMLARISVEHIQRHYGLKEWSSDVDFLTQLANKKGKLLRGGEPDLDGVAKSMIYDWQRVRI